MSEANLTTFVRVIRDIMLNKIISMRLELREMNEQLLVLERFCKDEMSIDKLEGLCKDCQLREKEK